MRNKGVAAFFRDAIRANAVVVIDSAEILLGAVSSEREPTFKTHTSLLTVAVYACMYLAKVGCSAV